MSRIPHLLLFMATLVVISGCKDIRVAELESQVANLESQIEEMHSKLSEAESKVADLESQLYEVRSKLNEAEYELLRLKSAIDDLDSAVREFDYLDWRIVVLQVQTSIIEVESIASDLEFSIADAVNAAQ
jgi:peptidoglycan hydrolase CwlO-like protein